MFSDIDGIPTPGHHHHLGLETHQLALTRRPELLRMCTYSQLLLSLLRPQTTRRLPFKHIPASTCESRLRHRQSTIVAD